MSNNSSQDFRTMSKGELIEYINQLTQTLTHTEDIANTATHTVYELSNPCIEKKELVKVADLISWLENTHMRLNHRYYGFNHARTTTERKLIQEVRAKTIQHIVKLWPDVKINPKGHKGYTR